MLSYMLTVNNIKILRIAQQCFMANFNSLAKKEMHVRLHVKYPSFFSDFNQIWIFQIGSHVSFQYQI